MASDPREAPEALLQLDEDTVVLIVGSDKKRMLMHRSHVQRSAFLHAAFKDVWAKGSRELKLPEDEVELVRLYLHYLYTGKIATKLDTSIRDRFEHEKENILHCRLYVLGEKLQDACFENTVIDAIVAKHNETGEDEEGCLVYWPPTGEAVDLLYQGTCGSSRARRLMIKLHLDRGHCGFILEEGPHNHQFPQDHCEEALEARWSDRQQNRHQGTGGPEPVLADSYHEKVK